MDAESRPFANDRQQLLARVGFLLRAAEAEIILRLTSIAEALKIVDDEIDLRSACGPLSLTTRELIGDLTDAAPRFAYAAGLKRMRKRRGCSLPEAGMHRVGRRTVENVELGAACGVGSVLRR